MKRNTSSSTAWGDVRSTPKYPSKERGVRDSSTMNRSYSARKNTIPKLSLDARQDTPLYKQGNEEYDARPVLPNYLNGNPNDNG